MDLVDRGVYLKWVDKGEARILQPLILSSFLEMNCST